MYTKITKFLMFLYERREDKFFSSFSKLMTVSFLIFYSYKIQRKKLYFLKMLFTSISPMVYLNQIDIS